MKPTNVFTDDSAVSPVIGVILMVAVTVIMAAVVGAFVLGLQSDVAVVPQTQWDTSTHDTSGNGTIDEVRFRHRAGDRIDTDRLSVQIPTSRSTVDGNATDDAVNVGDVIVVELDDSQVGPAGDDVLLVWTAEGGSDSVILAEHTFVNDYGDAAPDPITSAATQ